MTAQGLQQTLCVFPQIPIVSACGKEKTDCRTRTLHVLRPFFPSSYFSFSSHQNDICCEAHRPLEKGQPSDKAGDTIALLNIMPGIAHFETFGVAERDTQFLRDPALA